ncbi:hypothetical protein BHM03_00043257, partial [Ensete ventricosum]
LPTALDITVETPDYTQLTLKLASSRARRVGLDKGLWPRVHLTVVSAGHIDGQDPRRSQAAGGTRGHLPPHQLLSLPRGNPTSERLQTGAPTIR